MRAQLNGALQSATSVEVIKAHGDAFEAEYGPSVWACVSKGSETFAELYNQHLAREQERAQDIENDLERRSGILAEIEASDVKGWWSCKWFVDKRQELFDRADIIEALEERREFLEIPEEE